MLFVSATFAKLSVYMKYLIYCILNITVIVPNIAFGVNSLLSVVWSMVDATGF